MSQKVYRGYRDGYRTSEPVVVFVQENGSFPRALPGVFPPGPWDNGPGFEWGYDGAGPKNLAAAILADHLGRMPHFWLIDRFAQQVISRLNVAAPWTITGDQIEMWLKQRQRAKSFKLYEETHT